MRTLEHAYSLVSHGYNQNIKNLFWAKDEDNDAPYLHDILKGWMGGGYVMCLGNWKFFQRERRQCYCADYFEEPGYFCNF